MEQRAEREYMTVEEVATRLGVHQHTVRRWLRSGQLRGTKLSSRAGYRIPRDEVEKVLERGLREGKTAARNSLAAA
jgi:excisionase family DNA binding protein